MTLAALPNFLNSLIPVLRRGREKEQGQHRSAAPESTHMEPTPIFQSSQDPLGFVREGFVTFTPAQASAVLRECTYDRQRKIDKLHVATLRELMQRGSWTPKDKLDFAIMGGRLILVNGYHRMTAQADSGKSIEWTVAIHECRDIADVRGLYFKFDTNVRKRSENNILQGVGFGEQHGILAKTAKALYRAAPIIASGLMVGSVQIRGGSTADLRVQRIVDARLEFAEQFAAEAKAIETLMKPADKRVAGKMMSGGFFAVALVTMKHQPEKAHEFWGELFLNDRLRRGDPRSTLHGDMLTRDYKHGILQQTVVVPTKAWNAFFEGRDLKIIKVQHGQQLRLMGTRYTVRT